MRSVGRKAADFARGEWHSSQYSFHVAGCGLCRESWGIRPSRYSPLMIPPSATRTNGSTRRDVACCRSRTLTDHNSSEAQSGRRVAETPHRTRVFDNPSLVRSWSRDFAGLPGEDRRRRPDRCGQVPKGAGGCLGVISIPARKAAISPGELPNERRSRNARGTQGTESTTENCCVRRGTKRRSSA